MPMTKQQMFDTALAGVRAQGGLSANGRGSCMYRGPNGRKCGVGQLIPDALYDREMDEKSMTSDCVIELFPAVQELLVGGDKSNAEFLYDLQSAHDVALCDDWGDAENLKNFEARMRRLAHEYGLVYTAA